MKEPPRVAALWRYPVKSMLGEQCALLDLDERGVVGDRRWSVRTASGKIGSGKTSSRFEKVSGLLDLRASLRGADVVVTLPDGSAVAVDAADAAERLSRHLGRPVTLAAEHEVSHFDDGPVSLLGLASVAAVAADLGGEVDPRRFRGNIVLDTADPFAEQGWVGRGVRIGTCALTVTMPSPRCVMVNAATADLPAQPGVLTTVGRLNSAELGVIATVVTPGVVRVGDVVELAD